MNKLVIGLITALPIVAATGTPASAAPRDFVSGSGKFDSELGVGQANFTGHGSATDANGVIRLRVPGTDERVRARVSCVAVDGNRAAISGTLTEPTESGSTDVVLHVADNGRPRDTADTIGWAFSTGPIDCTTFLAGVENVVTRGNVVVKDRTP
ncbi:hypothetical protein [Nocardioides sp.]|uniref:hypothetical protein n=1 Tax=Nocardioides sp. TaxID=35761 RepID=UPI002D7E77DE|nr:hypothetical protein [Nocardioides sp.]HET8958840.1 hypothetical protein [Nocardioides sp.]